MHRDRPIPPPDRCAPGCDDQLPVFSRVGRGIHGDDTKVEIASDSCCETILEGLTYDHATNEWKSQWLSENINGGCLSYQYNLRPFTIPQTFTITFIYKRPGRCEWSWTTPAIPYVWSSDEAGDKEDPDHIVGSGVATLYVKSVGDADWKEKLVYPAGTGPEDFNTPGPEEPWTVNLSFGVGGDVEVPSLDDLSKLLGITVEQIRNIIAGQKGQFAGSDNVKDYVDDMLDHVHKDLGFEDGFLPGDGGDTSVKDYIDDKVGDLDANTSLKDYVDNALSDILKKIYLGGTLGNDGHITWPNQLKVPIADINLFGGSTTPTNSTMTDAMRSRPLSDDDLWGE